MLRTNICFRFDVVISGTRYPMIYRIRAHDDTSIRGAQSSSSQWNTTRFVHPNTLTSLTGDLRIVFPTSTPISFLSTPTNDEAFGRRFHGHIQTSSVACDDRMRVN